MEIVLQVRIKKALMNTPQIEAISSVRTRWLPLLDRFRTLDWKSVRKELESFWFV